LIAGFLAAGFLATGLLTAGDLRTARGVVLVAVAFTWIILFMK
jgi:hypothetical protein